jgi:putative oxidoreductase
MSGGLLLVERYLGRFSDVAYALLRFFAGTMFLFHGTQKLLSFPGGKPPAAFASLGWFAGVIEIVCGSMIALGLFAGWAAFLASGTMAVAYFKSHAPDAFLPIVNRGELAVLYCFVFLYIATKGSGKYALQRSRRR